MTHTPLVDTDDLADLRSDIRVLGGLLGRTLVRQERLSGRTGSR